ncbi:MAG TPA: HEAT repeat domain-containing protein [Gemmataceae bacterium]
MQLLMPCNPSFRRRAPWLGWTGLIPAALLAFLAANGQPRAADPPVPGNARAEIANALKPDQPAARRQAAVLLLGDLAITPGLDRGAFAAVEPNEFTDQVIKMATADHDVTVRQAAFTTLGRLHQYLADVMPTLTAVLHNKDKSRAREREAAVQTLGALASRAIPYRTTFGTLTGSGDNKVVVKVGDVDRTFKVDADTWITYQDEKETTKKRQEVSLNELDAKKGVDVWVSAKGESEPWTALRVQAFAGGSRDVSLDNLENISGVGAALIPLVGEALRDPNPAIRRAAANDLFQFATAARDSGSQAVPTHAKELANRQNLLKERQDLRRVLTPLLAAFRGQSPAIAQAMTEPDNPPDGAKSTRLLACQTLEELAALRELLPNSLDVARPKENGAPLEQVSLRLVAPAPEEKGDIGPLGYLVPILHALEKILTNRADPEVDARIAAVHALELLGVDGLPATPALVKALSDPDPFLRWTSARTLGTVEAARRRAKLPPVKGAEGAVDGLIALVYSPDPRVRVNLDTDAQIAAIGALASYEKEAEKAVDALGTVAAEDDFNARVAALSTLKSLWNQGVTKRPSTAALTRALAEQFPGHPQVQIAAAELLGLYGPAAANAVPALRGALEDPDIGVRRAASEALLRITR